ncbi:TauD/TfdA family dioxygenase [Streptomyces sp. NBC_00885]|uniref:TauD/TfdA family dioxygenase n=1 Tax=Streptomyces sp. NBC_00885 TaxID=2975857 RepID=UPI0038700679|nr:TauD/TfdA family dioxygenase [Streptomyces sp. NBC_00885]
MPNNTAEIRSVSVDDTMVTVTWGDDQQSRFHGLWLRDNCACEACGPHDRGSRLQRLLDIPDDIAPVTASVDGAALRIVWPGADTHVSDFDPAWLRAHAYSPRSVLESHNPVRTMWDGSLSEWPAVEWDRVLSDDAERHRLHASVSEVGFVLVRGLGTGHDGIEKLAEEVGYLRETHYGKFFDLITRPNPVILADLAGTLLPHTDEAYRRVPTGINMFHCLKASTNGGVSQLVDAFSVATQLKEQHPDAFELLTRVPVRHERRTEDQIITSDLPAIVLDHDGEIIEVRLNERTMTAICVDEELMAPTYAALRTAFRIAYDPANMIEYLMQPGDALLFDNLRVLHARTGYTGERHIRQCQVMRDEFFARGVSLGEKVNAPRSVLS